MTTQLEKTLKRELLIGGRPYVVAISPLALKLTQKGKRKGLELQWQDLVSGEAQLAAALQASVALLGERRPARKPGAEPRPRALDSSGYGSIGGYRFALGANG